MSAERCDNGCRREATKWTSEGYVCHVCANSLVRKDEAFRHLTGEGRYTYSEDRGSSNNS